VRGGLADDDIPVVLADRLLRVEVFVPGGNEESIGAAADEFIFLDRDDESFPALVTGAFADKVQFRDPAAERESADLLVDLPEQHLIPRQLAFQR
jgi:hypothetical protein